MLESVLADERKSWTVREKDEAVIVRLHQAPP
jgi:hypothetical protein